MNFELCGISQVSQSHESHESRGSRGSHESHEIFHFLYVLEFLVLTAQAMTDATANKGGFSSHKRHSPVDDKLEEKPVELSADVPQENDVIPISFVQLFRYVVLLFS